MEKYKTKANKAEEQILELLKDNKNIHRPWGLVKKKLINRTLECTTSEVRIIHVNNSNVRPGFEVLDDTVYIPNLFVKFSGIDENSEYFSKITDFKSQNNTYIYENFKGFCDNETKNLDLSLLFDDKGSLDKNFLLQSDRFSFSYLRREYQILFIDKVEEILKNKKSYFVSKTSNLSDEELLHILLNVDNNLITAFNEFDFHIKPPSVLINNNKKIRLTARQSASLLLLNFLGFDIIILSGQGYADIENEFPPEVYTLFYGEKISKHSKLSRKTKQFLIASSIAVISTVILLGSILPNINNPQEIPEAVIPDQNIEISETDDSSVTDILLDEVNDTPQEDVEGVSMSIIDDSEVKGNISTIKISVYGPDGNAINMSDISYTVSRGARVESKDKYTGHGMGWDDGPEFEISEGYVDLTFLSSEDGSDFTYMLSNDDPDFAFLIEGRISKADYIENRKMEIVYKLNGLNKVFLSADTANDPVDEVEYYIYSNESILSMPTEEANQGCRGIISTSKGKYLYTNIDTLNVFMFYNSDDGLVFYQGTNFRAAIQVIEIRLDKRQYQTRSMTINPALKDFTYFLATIHFPRFRTFMWGEVPENLNLNVYSNAFLPSNTITLSKKLYDEYETGLFNIKLNGDVEFGYNSKITNMTFSKNKSGKYNIHSLFTDSNGNDFRFLGCYDKFTSPVDKYEYNFKISQDGITLLDENWSAYYEEIELNLSDGTYNVTVKPAHDNELYSITSYFTLTIDSKSDYPYSMQYKSSD